MIVMDGERSWSFDSGLHFIERCDENCGFCEFFKPKRTAAEESLIRAAIEFVARNNLVAGPLTRAVQDVERERRDR